jgi:HD superfamily phosphohydrolase
MTTIRDNVHGDISINDKVIYELINTSEFQRLKRIAQLGGAQHVFIGASHTRFAHCLGVYHLVTKFLENPNILNQKPFDDEKNRLTVKVAGLLHDIGHGPFSHSFEKVGVNHFKHEHYSSLIITSPETKINKILVKHGIDPKVVADIIEGKCEDNLMNLLVSSQLDADRLDYLLRDSINAGVTYSKVDVDWIIRHIKIEDEKIVFPIKAMYAIEAYLLGRYYMYNQVYCHKTSFAFDETLHMWFKRLSYLIKSGQPLKGDYGLVQPLVDGTEFNVNAYLELDDCSFIQLIQTAKHEDDAILKDFAQRIINREFLETAVCHPEDVEAKKAEVAALGYDTDYYFALKDQPVVEIYNKKIKKGKDELIYIQDTNGVIEDISHFSAVVTAKGKEKNKKIIFLPKN